MHKIEMCYIIAIITKVSQLEMNHSTKLNKEFFFFLNADINLSIRFCRCNENFSIS